MGESRWPKVYEDIRKCRQFRRGNNGVVTICGEVSLGEPSLDGAMPLTAAERDSIFDPDVDYIVYSYADPIAWHNEESDEWVVRLVKEWMSKTTVGHVNHVRRALSYIDRFGGKPYIFVYGGFDRWSQSIQNRMRQDHLVGGVGVPDGFTATHARYRTADEQPRVGHMFAPGDTFTRLRRDDVGT